MKTPTEILLFLIGNSTPEYHEYPVSDRTYVAPGGDTHEGKIKSLLLSCAGTTRYLCPAEMLAEYIGEPVSWYRHLALLHESGVLHFNGVPELGAGYDAMNRHSCYDAARGHVGSNGKSWIAFHVREDRFLHGYEQLCADAEKLGLFDEGVKLREEIASLKAKVEQQRLEIHFQSAPIFSRLECVALEAAREIEQYEHDARTPLTDEQRARAKAAIQALLKAREGESLPPREPTLLEIAERRNSEMVQRGNTIAMKLVDIAREANIPIDTFESLSAHAIVGKLRGEHVSAWSWDSDLRRKCDEMRDGLGVDSLGPYYDSDNHEWRVVTRGGNEAEQRTLDVCAQSWAPSPGEAILRAWKAFQEK